MQNIKWEICSQKYKSKVRLSEISNLFYIYDHKGNLIRSIVIIVCIRETTNKKYFKKGNKYFDGLKINGKMSSDNFEESLEILSSSIKDLFNYPKYRNKHILWKDI